MHIRFLKAVMLLCSLSAFTLTVNAQSPLANVHVPFAFIAGGKTLPAGDYVFEDPEMSSVLLIRGRSGASVVVMTMPADPNSHSDTATLTFERRGDQMFLAGLASPAEAVRVPVASEPGAKLTLLPKVALP